MIPVSQRKATICTKKNAKRIDATAFVCEKPTCTSDCRTRAIRMAGQLVYETAGDVPD
jgi:hypothetical protein